MRTRVFKQIARGLRKKAPVILMFSGIFSAVGTAVSTAIATKKATDKINESEDELDTKEKVKTAAPYFVAPLLSLGSTIGCFIGLNHIHSKRYRALLSGYVMLQQTYDISKNGAAGSFGVMAGAGAAKAVAEKKNEKKEEPEILCHDTLKDRYFRARYSDVVVAEYNCNEYFLDHCVCPLSVLYQELGLPYDEEDEKIGWDEEWICYNWGKMWIEFRHKFISEEGHEPYMQIIAPVTIDLDVGYHELYGDDTCDFDKR